ncbi:MAG: hypothetical protein ACPG77_05445, partial [Nannocystaceae bacterium]
MTKAVYLGALALAAICVACDKPPEQTNPPGNTGQPTQGVAPGQPGQPGQPGPGQPGAVAQGPGQQPGPTEPVRNGQGVVPGSLEDPNYTGKHVAHSRGTPNGVMVLWPRIIPSNTAEQNQPMAASLQQHLKAVAAKALPGRTIDVRPSPERVCPRGGCDGPSISVLFNRTGNACLAIALVNPPGESNTKMIPWAGTVELTSDSVPFRSPPESQVKIKDYVPCDALLGELGKQDAFVEAALRAAAAQGPSAPAGTAAPPAGPSAPPGPTAR